MVTKKVWRCTKQPKDGDAATHTQEWMDHPSSHTYVPAATNGRCSQWRQFPSRASYMWEKRCACEGKVHTLEDCTSIRSRMTPGRWCPPWGLVRKPASSGGASKDGQVLPVWAYSALKGPTTYKRLWRGPYEGRRQKAGDGVHSDEAAL